MGEREQNRYTEADLDRMLREHDAFQWVMIEHWFEVGVHVVVDESGEPIEWAEAKKRAAERNRDWALDEAVRHAKKRAHLDPDKPAPREQFIEHLHPAFRRAFRDRQVARYVESSPSAPNPKEQNHE